MYCFCHLRLNLLKGYLFSVVQLGLEACFNMCLPTVFLLRCWFNDGWPVTLVQCFPNFLWENYFWWFCPISAFLTSPWLSFSREGASLVWNKQAHYGFFFFFSPSQAHVSISSGTSPTAPNAKNRSLMIKQSQRPVLWTSKFPGDWLFVGSLCLVLPSKRIPR